MISLTADRAEPGDVVLDADGSVYQYSGDGQWMQMDLVLTESGSLWHPGGELVLLARGGHPAL